MLIGSVQLRFGGQETGGYNSLRKPVTRDAHWLYDTDGRHRYRGFRRVTLSERSVTLMIGKVGAAIVCKRSGVSPRSSLAFFTLLHKLCKSEPCLIRTVARETV
jgi:hypothetical protein